MIKAEQSNQEILRKMNNIQIRRAYEEDISYIIQLRWDICKEQGSTKEAYRKEYEVTLRTFLAKHLPHDYCQIWVAETEEKIIGTAALWLFPMLPEPTKLSSFQGYVTNVYTQPGYRKKGVSANLMQALEEAAIAFGASSITLSYTDFSENLFRRLGYSESGKLIKKLKNE